MAAVLTPGDNLPKRIKRTYEIPEEGISITEHNKDFFAALERCPMYNKIVLAGNPGVLSDPLASAYGFNMEKKAHPNLVDPTMFPGAWEIEREAISMLAHLFDHPDHKKAFGWFTDGGTASIEQAGWTFRNRFYRDLESMTNREFDKYKNRGTIRENGLLGLVANGFINPSKQPIILAPVDAHFAIEKVADVLGIGQRNIIRYGLNPDFTTDYKSLENLLHSLSSQEQKIMFAFANAGAVNTGRIENTEEFTRILNNCLDYRVPVIVDAAQQWLLLGLFRHLYPVWDFRANSVDAIVADPHKTEAAPYSSSAILFRSKDYANDTKNANAYLCVDDPLEYDMKEEMMLLPTLATSRTSIGATSTWAYLRLNGKQRLRDKHERLLNITDTIANYIKTSKYYTLLCEPQTTIVPFHVKNLDDAEASCIYRSFITSLEEPRFYIGRSDCMRVRSCIEFLQYSQLKDKNPNTKVNGFGGLYIQVMPNLTEALSQRLIEKLDRFGFENAGK